MSRATIAHIRKAAALGILSLLYSPIGWVVLAIMAVAVVHAVRGGNFLWVYVIVFLPGIGSLIYIAVEILPGLFRSRTASRMRSGATAALDPNRDYRQALREAEMVGSVDAKRALAEQYVQRGQIGEALEIYKSVLQGQFKDDPALLLHYARAQFLGGDAAGAQATLDHLQAVEPKFQSEEAHMIYARALEAQGKNDEALEEYKRLVRYAGGEEARTRYAALLEKTGHRDDARALYEQVVKNIDNGQRHYRSAQKEWGDLARAGLKR
ncbi:MAG TPA: tetratricopeptide repeat protein [Rhizomicrobium sp.]|jgi:hypothetical protein